MTRFPSLQGVASKLTQVIKSSRMYHGMGVNVVIVKIEPGEIQFFYLQMILVTKQLVVRKY